MGWQPSEHTRTYQDHSPIHATYFTRYGQRYTLSFNLDRTLSDNGRNGNRVTGTGIPICIHALREPGWIYMYDLRAI